MIAPFWTPELDRKLRELRAEGMGNPAIAQALGCANGTVCQRVRALNLPRRRVGEMYGYWTKERDDVLRQLWAQRPLLTLNAIVVGLGSKVSKSYVSARAGELGLPLRTAHGRSNRPRLCRAGEFQEPEFMAAPTPLRAAPRFVYERVVGCTVIDPHGDGSRCGKGKTQTCEAHRHAKRPIPKGTMGHGNILSDGGRVRTMRYA